MRKIGVTGAEKGKRPDQIIPSLAEYVNICKKYDKKCVLELKNKFEPEDIARMVEEFEWGVDFITSNILE